MEKKKRKKNIKKRCGKSKIKDFFVKNGGLYKETKKIIRTHK